MPRSVNVNDEFWGQRTIEDGPDDGSTAVDDSGDFVIAQPGFASADPHRALRSVADIFAPAPTRDRGLKRVPDSAGGARNASAPKASAQPDLGPCLYFGAAGERCDRRAVNSGYCARHQNSRTDWSNANAATSSVSLPQVSKRAIGAAGILAVLWPILADLIRELIRLFR